MGAPSGDRLRIRYDVEAYGKVRELALPYVIGVMADLSGKPAGERPPIGEREFHEVTWTNLGTLKWKVGSDGSKESWKGMEHLVGELSTGPTVKVRVLDLAREELYPIFEEFGGELWDRSPIFQRIYEYTYGVFGGEPYALLLADYRLTFSGADLRVREELDKVSDAAAAPILLPIEDRPAGEIYSLAAEIGNTVARDGWCGALERPSWIDEIGLDFEKLRRLLCCGPFVHHLKGQVRDRFGEFKSREAMEQWLGMWLARYVGGEATTLQKPLIEGAVRLEDNEIHPGAWYEAKFSLRPGFGFDAPEPEVLEGRLPGVRKQ